MVGLLAATDSSTALAIVALMALAVGALVMLRKWLVTLVRLGESRGRIGTSGALAHGSPTAPGGSPSVWLSLTDRAAAHTRIRLSSLGWFPWIAFVAACSLYLVVYGYTLSRSGTPGGEPWFLIGLAGIIAPIGIRLASNGVRTLERVLLIILLVVLFYLVKVTHDPFAFTFSDEFVHLANVEHVLSTGQLPDQNSIIPVSAQYPGLASVAAAVAFLTGFSGFGAGLIVIGIAKVVLALGLFLLLQRISGSARIASLGVVFYACAINYLFFGSQFAYQSLAFPLAMLALVAAVSRTTMSGNGRLQGRNLLWTGVAIVATSAVVVTHHLTSFAVAILMLSFALGGSLLVQSGRVTRWIPPWDIAALAIVASIGWLFLQAGDTAGYLGSIFGTALEGSLDVVAGEESARKLFESGSGYTSPIWQRVVSLAALGLTLVGVIVGALRGGKIFGSPLMFRIFALVAFVYIASFALRVFPTAWEMSNRMSDYAFVGVAAMLAVATVYFLRQRWGGPIRPLVLGLSIGLLVVGATMTSWPPSVLLPLPYRVSAAETTFAPEGDSLAGWSRERLGTGRTFAADRANGRLLLAAGGQVAYVTRTPNARVLLEAWRLDAFQLGVMREVGLEYVVVDRRLSTDDNMAGYFFDGHSLVGPIEQGTRPESVLEKFELEPQVSRVLDSGNAVVYDVRPLRDAVGQD